jgi:hypothetical protein
MAAVAEQHDGLAVVQVGAGGQAGPSWPGAMEVTAGDDI